MAQTTRVVGPGFHDKVFAQVAKIPRGRVSTYGDIAARLGARSVARHVGHALAALPYARRGVPWHRVVNAQGWLSGRAAGDFSQEQRQRLLDEGVDVDESGKIRGFAKIRWPSR